jgi:hypothetical protein
MMMVMVQKQGVTPGSATRLQEIGLPQRPDNLGPTPVFYLRTLTPREFLTASLPSSQLRQLLVFLNLRCSLL